MYPHFTGGLAWERTGSHKQPSHRPQHHFQVQGRTQVPSNRASQWISTEEAGPAGHAP